MIVGYFLCCDCSIVRLKMLLWQWKENCSKKWFISGRFSLTRLFLCKIATFVSSLPVQRQWSWSSWLVELLEQSWIQPSWGDPWFLAALPWLSWCWNFLWSVIRYHKMMNALLRWWRDVRDPRCLSGSVWLKLGFSRNPSMASPHKIVFTNDSELWNLDFRLRMMQLQLSQHYPTQHYNRWNCMTTFMI